MRSSWVETGLRIGSIALVPSKTSLEEQLEWWEQGAEQVFSEDSSADDIDALRHPTLWLLHQLISASGPISMETVGDKKSSLSLSRCHFDDILKARRDDLSIRQYATLDQLEEHAVWSCGSLSQLVLEADNIFETQHSLPYEAVKLVGRAHGLTNALRLSIPVVSSTGRLVIPQGLCEKYGVMSPRYLLSLSVKATRNVHEHYN